MRSIEAWAKAVKLLHSKEKIFLTRFMTRKASNLLILPQSPTLNKMKLTLRFFMPESFKIKSASIDKKAVTAC